MKLPNHQELQALRKGQRKRKPPRIFDGMWCSEPGIGGVKLTTVGSDFNVEWVSFDNGSKSEVKHAVWSSLCSDPDFEMRRLEIGFIVSEILQTQGQKVMDSIGHPINALKEAKPYRDTAEEWKHWATVKAGHMIGY